MININDKDYEIAEIINKLGANRPTSLALTLIKDGEEHTMREIEHTFGLSQPEVSLAMKELTIKGMVSVRYERKEGKGRPVNVYKLKVPFERIIEEFEKQLSIKTDNDRKMIGQLKHLCSQE